MSTPHLLHSVTIYFTAELEPSLDFFVDREETILLNKHLRKDKLSTAKEKSLSSFFYYYVFLK